MNGRIFWALVLILVGAVLLLNNLGLIQGSVWNLLWPLFLILLGVMFLIGASGRGRRWAAAAIVNDSLPLDGAASAEIKFQHGAGQLFVNAGTDPNTLYSGSFGGGVDKDVRRRGSALDVTMRAAPGAWLGPWDWWGGRGTLDWNVGLNPSVPLSLAFETGASQTRLDLSALRVTDLSLKTGASATDVTMPSGAGRTRARIESGVASVNVRIPTGVAARISGKMGLGALNVDQQRFPNRSGVYESDDFATAVNRVELQIDGGVASIDVK